MNVLIIEDELFSAQRLEMQLSKIDSNISVIDILASVAETINWFNSNENPDLLFLDIHLQDKNSFEVFKTLDLNVPIIYTTAFDNYTLEAFKQNTIDYLLKPIDIEELKNAISKFTLLHPKKETQVLHPQNRFLVKKGSQFVSIPIVDVAYFKSEQKLNFLVTSQNDKHVIDLSLDQLTALVDNKKFFRINRSRLIKFESIVGIHSYFNNRLKLDLLPTDSEEVLVSRDRVTNFKNWLNS